MKGGSVKAPPGSRLGLFEIYDPLALCMVADRHEKSLNKAPRAIKGIPLSITLFTLKLLVHEKFPAPHVTAILGATHGTSIENLISIRIHRQPPEHMLPLDKSCGSRVSTDMNGR